MRPIRHRHPLLARSPFFQVQPPTHPINTPPPELPPILPPFLSPSGHVGRRAAEPQNKPRSSPPTIGALMLQSSPASPTSAAAMDHAKPHFRLLTRLSAPSANPKRPPGDLWIPIAALAALACIFFGLRSHGMRRFGVVIDGGSTGTRVHVFAYIAGRGELPMVDVGSMVTTKVGPGLSAYAGRPEDAGESLLQLLEFARRSVPRGMWGATEVRLMATAGMRLLEDAVQERILESCRKVLRGSGLAFRDEWAEVITGSDEGIYAWVTANYALGTLTNDHQQTTGVIELGGASAQITFVSSETLPPKFTHSLKFGKVTHNLYTHSFLHFGQNVAYETTRMLLSSSDLKSTERTPQEGVLDPCSPKGYFHASHSESTSANLLGVNARYASDMHGTGNFSACQIIAQMLLHKGKDKCLYRQCHIGSTYVPKLQGNFLATENFFYTSKFLGLSPSARLSDMVSAGEQYCGTDWLKIKERHHSFREEDLLQYCFSSAYIVAFLHDSLGIDLDEQRIRFVNRVRSIPLDWAMGAFIMQRMSADAEDQPASDWINNIINNDSLKLLAVLGVFSVLAVAVWSSSKWKKPQLKTIYDLEKGRYIISRLRS